MEALKSPLMGLFEKRRAGKFFLYVQDYKENDPSTHKGYDLTKLTTKQLISWVPILLLCLRTLFNYYTMQFSICLHNFYFQFHTCLFHILPPDISCLMSTIPLLQNQEIVMWNLDIFTNNIIYAFQVLISLLTPFWIIKYTSGIVHASGHYIVLFVSLTAITEASKVFLDMLCPSKPQHDVLF
jgi:hypothetical protein